ncbi:Octanoyltransferase LipM [Rubripirellula tenax]|uniref:Octanoyltransferase LipM n=1 Tax=Rubripirellula tenax TaxID=2528015 RepID=A0A5C6ERC1_9BACT|nr:lipoate--protein ligase family protein [Rubripirellula tenax]TWU50860.1 Octanoyltransferase LipM [Rubripirellula tenax]
MIRPGRLIAFAAGDAAENMALDQALLESIDGGSEPTLRLYGWRSPTLSLGYFQSHLDRQTHVESAGVDCVRRASGGGAILHEHELTYSLAWPMTGMSAGANKQLYRQTHAALADAIADFGVRGAPFSMTGRNVVERVDGESESESETTGDPFLCFQRRTDDDLIVNGYKVLGSAQRKGRRAVLQHGSLLVRASRFAPQLPGIWDLGGTSESITELADAVAETISRHLKICWKLGSWSPVERERAEHWSAERFGTSAWLERR